MQGPKKDRGKRGRNGGHGTGIIAKRRKLDVGKGCKGVFLTCNRQPLDACNEFINILDRYLEEYASPAAPSNPKEERGSCVADDVAAGIAAEVAGISDRAKRFQVHNQLLPGVVFIRFTKEEDVPSDLCHGLLKRALETPGKYSCRHASRLLPIDICANSSLEDLAAACRRLCRASLPWSNAALNNYPEAANEEKESATEEKEKAAAAASDTHAEGGTPDTPAAAETDEASAKTEDGSSTLPSQPPNCPNPPEVKGTWACAFSSRGFGTATKEQVLNLLTREVGKSYKVDIANADYTFLVEVNPYFFGVSLVHDYGRLYRYNLHRCCHPEGEGEAKQKPQLSKP